MTRHRHQHLAPTMELELWARGARYVAGLDEVGRGPWAGPVTAAAVVLPRAPVALDALDGVRDSKTLRADQRELLFDRIHAVAQAIGVGSTDAAEIDAWGIVTATRVAMRRALDALSLEVDALILDAITLPEVDIPQTAFPRADSSVLSVAAASIIAKVVRDRWMTEVAEVHYRGYGFARHKGYGTAQHRIALRELGPSPLHRLTFRPIAELLHQGRR